MLYFANPVFLWLLLLVPVIPVVKNGMNICSCASGVIGVPSFATLMIVRSEESILAVMLTCFAPACTAFLMRLMSMRLI